MVVVMKMKHMVVQNISEMHLRIIYGHSWLVVDKHLSLIDSYIYSYKIKRVNYIYPL